ncbi:hypothetical protein BCC0191_004002 [Burkholderia ambifaria]
MTVSRHPFSLSYRSNIFPIIRPTVVRISRAGAGVFPARSIRPCTVEDESASSCPARTTWPILGNGMKMKRSTAAGRSSCATTGAPARATRGSRETGSDEPAKLALHRESYYTLSDYPKGAQGMRESSCCFWSSSLFPDCLLTSWPPPIFDASGRPLAGASNIASGMPCVIPPMVARRMPAATRAPVAGNRVFCFRNVSRRLSAACADH